MLPDCLKGQYRRFKNKNDIAQASTIRGELCGKTQRNKTSAFSYVFLFTASQFMEWISDSGMLLFLGTAALRQLTVSQTINVNCLKVFMKVASFFVL
ncbi:hypothetical protein BLX87_23720 [Bacillus sp. VT-16-64]|nr:hypothetical protein BLX87_23720 [Bacillus sp. VT-16-64]